MQTIHQISMRSKKMNQRIMNLNIMRSMLMRQTSIKKKKTF